MATEYSRRIPEDKAASLDEINDAINSLTPAQYKRLEIYAKWRINGLDKKKIRYDWKYLLQEAMVAFCSDGRRWNKEKVDFVKALTEAMRSISSNWKRAHDNKEPRLEADLITTSLSGEESNSLTSIATPGKGAQSELEAKEKIESIENLVAGREKASLILIGWKDKMTGAEIREVLEISQEEYDKEVKWIRRTIRAAFEEQGNV